MAQELILTNKQGGRAYWQELEAYQNRINSLPHDIELIAWHIEPRPDSYHKTFYWNLYPVLRSIEGGQWWVDSQLGPVFSLRLTH